MPKAYVLHNNNDEKLLTNCKKNSPTNHEVIYPFFILDKFIDFSESM